MPLVSPEETEQALRKIVDQTQRIHTILRELMQFARPPQPHAQPFDAGDLVQEVATSLADLATQRRVRIVVPPPGAVRVAPPTRTRSARR